MQMLYWRALAPQVALAEHIHEPLEEGGALMAIIGIIFYLVRHFFGKRKYEGKLRRLESKMENDKTDGSLSGTKNPGRSTVDLLDVMYDEMKDIKRTLTRHEGELGKIKGKLDIR